MEDVLNKLRSRPEGAKVIAEFALNHSNAECPIGRMKDAQTHLVEYLLVRYNGDVDSFLYEYGNGRRNEIDEDKVISYGRKFLGLD